MDKGKLEYIISLAAIEDAGSLLSVALDTCAEILDQRFGEGFSGIRPEILATTATAMMQGLSASVMAERLVELHEAIENLTNVLENTAEGNG